MPTDAGTNNVYDLVITALDATANTSTQTVAVTVTDLDETDTTPPSIAGVQTVTVNENQTAVATYSADEAVAWTISGGVDAAQFSIDPATGVLIFATAPDFEAPSDAGTDNVYDVIIAATDGAQATPQHSPLL